MNQRISKVLREIAAFKVYRPRRYFTLQRSNQWGRSEPICRVADQERELYQLAKRVYKKTGDLQHVTQVVQEARQRAGAIK